MSKVVMISSDCHAGALPEGYKPYMPKEFHAAADAWWLQYAREMMKRFGTFFDQEAAQEFNSRSGDEGADAWIRQPRRRQHVLPMPNCGITCATPTA